MKELKLICRDFISNNHYLNYRVIRKNGKNIVAAYKAEKTSIFEKQFGLYVAKQMREQNWKKPEKGKLIFLESTFFLPRVDMDCSNYWKSLLDTLTKVGVWEDDNVVMEKVNRLYYDKENPRIEITIYEAEFLGVFNGDDHYREFVENCCNKCKKNIDKCTIHKSCLENRLTSSYDLEKNICLKLKK